MIREERDTVEMGIHWSRALALGMLDPDLVRPRPVSWLGSGYGLRWNGNAWMVFLWSEGVWRRCDLHHAGSASALRQPWIASSVEALKEERESIKRAGKAPRALKRAT